MNRLSKEQSPYLQMHADNPVDWYPWGEEAFAEAREQDKPVFLSIGYSSCHWCHVIAHESFENAGLAAELNADYISVKVDKEERPDVDAVYMDAVELATGSGGWPMTLLVTPDGKPFFAATYLPREALSNLLEQAAELWQTDRPTVQESAEDFYRHMLELADREPAPREPDSALTESAVKAYAVTYDRQWGGFGRAPKFPAAHNLLFLLAHYERTGDAAALAMAEGALKAMYSGGIFDHVGGGFCRYGVDRKWLIPHFEKMLYDNALLVWAYAEAWRVTRNPLYDYVARRTVDYVLREMTGPEGQFYCAQDADSEGREGAYYVFDYAELVNLLGDAEGGMFCAWYGIEPGGNFEGMSIPNRIDRAKDVEGEKSLEPLRAKVYRYRRERMALGRDDKVLLSWNALMITALCAAAKALNVPEYLEAARRAESFLRANMTDSHGGLALYTRSSEAHGAGVLADYAFYALALMKLHEATGQDDYLCAAEQTADEMLRRFEDAAHGGLYLYGSQGEQLITRPKEVWDAAMPSGNSCAALALLMLAKATREPRWQEAARRQLRFVAGAAAGQPSAHGFGLLAVTRALEQ